MTGLIDRLERLGLVERAADPGDRHKVLVRVREEGIAPIAAYFAPMEKTMQGMLAGYSKDELKLLVDFTDRGAAFVLARVAELNEGKGPAEWRQRLPDAKTRGMAILLSENFRALFYAPFYAAEATGAFKAAGVEVVLKPSPDPPSAGRALLAGEVDVMWGGPLRVMNTHHADPGSSLVCFCDVVARDPFFIIGKEPRPNFKLADLVGLKVATVSEVPTPWVCLQDDLRRAGINPDRLTRITDKTMAENEAALRAGTVDAIQVFQPYAEQSIRSGAGHVWYAAADRGLTAYTTLVTRREVLTKRKAELLSMTKALYRTLGWFAATPARDIARTLASYFPDVPADLFAQCIERYRNHRLWASDPVIRREGYDRLHAAMRSAGLLKRDIAFEACVDTKLAEEAMA